MLMTVSKLVATAVSVSPLVPFKLQLKVLVALHFKLVLEPEGDGRTTSFEDIQFLYTPLLDSNRDRDMIERLPYYLKEDITFSRHHAAKFYSRVVDALTKKEADE